MINQNSKMNVKNIETTNHKLKSQRAYRLLFTTLHPDKRIFFSLTPDEARNGTAESGWRIADSRTTLPLGLLIL